MKKATKIVLMTTLSYLVIEEPELCQDFLKVLNNGLEAHVRKETRKELKKRGLMK